MAGSYEPIGAGAAEDLLYSCLYGFGIENAYWKHGQIKVPKRKEIEEIYIPQLQKTKNIALFLPDEILQIAKENSSLCGESTNLLFERINECKLETSIKWILPTKDRALNPKQQRVYMNNIGNIKSIIKLTAPHDVMISHPEEVAKILLEN